MAPIWHSMSSYCHRSLPCIPLTDDCLFLKCPRSTTVVKVVRILADIDTRYWGLKGDNLSDKCNGKLSKSYIVTLFCTINHKSIIIILLAESMVLQLNFSTNTFIGVLYTFFNLCHSNIVEGPCTFGIYYGSFIILWSR